MQQSNSVIINPSPASPPLSVTTALQAPSKPRRPSKAESEMSQHADTEITGLKPKPLQYLRLKPKPVACKKRKGI